MGRPGILIGPDEAGRALWDVEIPATDVGRSAAFYERVFGWRIRQRGHSATAFDDTTEEVSGAWVTDRLPAGEPGLLLYVMVDSVAETVEAVVAHRGEIVQPIGADAPEITARFRDPGGTSSASTRSRPRSRSSRRQSCRASQSPTTCM